MSVPRKPRSVSRRRPRIINQVPVTVESTLPIPPSASTSTDPPILYSDSDFDLSVAVRKGKHTCTYHPISNFVSFDHLSPSFKAFSLSVSSIAISKSYREALSHPGWRKAMEEEMHALDLNHTWNLIPNLHVHRLLAVVGFSQSNRILTVL